MVFYQSAIPGLDSVPLPGGGFSVPSAGNLLIFLTTIVVCSAVLIGLFVYLFRLIKKRKFNIKAIIIEEVNGHPYVRGEDMGGIFPTEDGPMWQFFKEKPLVPPATPGPQSIGAPSTFPSEQLSEHEDGVQHGASSAPAAPLAPISKQLQTGKFGARFKWKKAYTKNLVPNKLKHPMIIFLYREGQYFPYKWDFKYDDPAFEVVSGADQRYYIEMMGKLVKRHLLREDRMKQLLPFVVSASAIVIVLVGLVFIYLMHKDLSDVTLQAMDLGRQMMEAGKTAGIQKVVEVPPA